jgi:hypothetical protein
VRRHGGGAGRHQRRHDAARRRRRRRRVCVCVRGRALWRGLCAPRAAHARAGGAGQ